MQQVQAILKNLTSENYEESFHQILDTDLFKYDQTILCSHFTSYYLDSEDQTPISEFFKFLINIPEYTTAALDLIIFWLRQISPQNIEILIQTLEDTSMTLRKIYTESDKGIGRTISRLFVMLNDKISLSVMPSLESSINDDEVIPSSEFSKRISTLLPSARLSSIRGRALICSSRIFPYDPVTNVKRDVLNTVPDISDLANAIQVVCQGNPAPTPLQLTALSNFLKDVKPPSYGITSQNMNDCNNSIPIPSVISSLNLIFQPSKLNAVVFLQLALIGLIHSNDKKYNFETYVRHFATDYCHVDADLLIKLVEEGRAREELCNNENSSTNLLTQNSQNNQTNQNNEQNDEQNNDQKEINERMNGEDAQFQSLFPEFELPEDEQPQIDELVEETPDMIEEQIRSFAGDEKQFWLSEDNDEQQIWRIARLAMENSWLLDQISSDAFQFLNTEEVEPAPEINPEEVEPAEELNPEEVGPPPE